VITAGTAIILITPSPDCDITELYLSVLLQDILGWRNTTNKNCPVAGVVSEDSYGVVLS